jgi:PTH1 family peptidyl-tRNA hydrolase
MGSLPKRHRGLASLVEEIGGGGFGRIRIGVGRPPEPEAAAEYVLSPPSSAERELVERAVDLAADLASRAVPGAENGS